MEITSIQNQKVKDWMKLKEKKYRDETGLFLIEGDHILKEALEVGLVKEIISLEKIQIEKIESYVVTKEIMKRLSHQVTSPEVMAVCKKKEESIDNNSNIIILDRIQDPGNLGTIIRSAIAFSYSIILGEGCVDEYNEKVIRSTEGMIFHANIKRCNLEEELPKLKKQNYHIYGTNVVNGTSLKNIKFPEKKAIIIGNEGQGMNPLWNQYVNDFIYIPMNSQCESLNAAMSASIIMYESGDGNE